VENTVVVLKTVVWESGNVICFLQPIQWKCCQERIQSFEPQWSEAEGCVTVGWQLHALRKFWKGIDQLPTMTNNWMENSSSLFNTLQTNIKIVQYVVTQKWLGRGMKQDTLWCLWLEACLTRRREWSNTWYRYNVTQEKVFLWSVFCLRGIM